jgi:hypothetical protein
MKGLWVVENNMLEQKYGKVFRMKTHHTDQIDK